MPAYKTIATLSAEPEEMVDALKAVVMHRIAWGYTISNVTVVTGQISVTVSRALTAAEREHLGLV
jgi:hypothetical protein